MCVGLWRGSVSDETSQPNHAGGDITNSQNQDPYFVDVEEHRYN